MRNYYWEVARITMIIVVGLFVVAFVFGLAASIAVQAISDKQEVYSG